MQFNIFVLENFSCNCTLNEHTMGLVLLFRNELINQCFKIFSILIYNIVNIDKHNLHQQMSLGALSNF